MASKNLRKILNYVNNPTSDFDPNKYTINVENARKYILAKHKRMMYNELFQMYYRECREEGYEKKQAKQRAKSLVKAHQSTPSSTAQPGSKESEEVLQEG